MFSQVQKIQARAPTNGRVGERSSRRPLKIHWTRRTALDDDGGGAETEPKCTSFLWPTPDLYYHIYYQHAIIVVNPLPFSIPGAAPSPNALVSIL